MGEWDAYMLVDKKADFIRIIDLSSNFRYHSIHIAYKDGKIIGKKEVEGLRRC